MKDIPAGIVITVIGGICVLIIEYHSGFFNNAIKAYRNQETQTGLEQKTNPQSASYQQDSLLVTIKELKRKIDEFEKDGLRNTQKQMQGRLDELERNYSLKSFGQEVFPNSPNENSSKLASNSRPGSSSIQWPIVPSEQLSFVLETTSTNFYRLRGTPLENLNMLGRDLVSCYNSLHVFDLESIKPEDGVKCFIGQTDDGLWHYYLVRLPDMPRPKPNVLNVVGNFQYYFAEVRLFAVYSDIKRLIEVSIDSSWRTREDAEFNSGIRIFEASKPLSESTEIRIRLTWENRDYVANGVFLDIHQLRL